MNCEEFQRAIMQDPMVPGDEALGHAAECERCSHELERVRELEKRLVGVLLEEEAAQLKPRLLGQLQLGRDGALSRLAGWRQAVIAGLCLALFMGGWMGTPPGGRDGHADGLAKRVVDHINAETRHLGEHEEVKGPELATQLSRFGIVLVGEFNGVNFASPCWIRNRMGLHLVVSEQAQPVTLLIMPGQFVRRSEPIVSDRYLGVVLPTAYGSLAVVGYGLNRVRATAERFRDAAIWQDKTITSPRPGRSLAWTPTSNRYSPSTARTCRSTPPAPAGCTRFPTHPCRSGPRYWARLTRYWP